MADLRYYIGPWVWDENAWAPPEGCVGVIDLGTNADVAQATGDNRSIGLFCQDPARAQLATDWALLGRGDCREMAYTAAMRDAWQSMLGTRPSVAGNPYLVDALYAHLTDLADDAGNDTCPPLMPTVSRVLEIHLGGHSVVKSERFDLAEPRHRRVLARIKRDLVELRTESRAGRRGRSSGRGAGRRFEVDTDFHRRYLLALCEKLRIDPSGDDWQILRPQSWPAGERPMPHSTTITESFDTANSDTLGPDLTWSEIRNDSDVSSNTCYQRAGASETWTSARAQSDLSSADHYSQCVDSGFGTGFAASSAYRMLASCAVRFSSSAETYYAGGPGKSTSARNYTTYKIVSGTATGLVGNGDGGGDSRTSKVEINGSTLKVYADGVEQVSTTDTSITGGTRCGLATRLGISVNVTKDDFEAADLAATFVPLDEWGRAGFFGV